MTTMQTDPTTLDDAGAAAPRRADHARRRRLRRGAARLERDVRPPPRGDRARPGRRRRRRGRRLRARDGHRAGRPRRRPLLRRLLDRRRRHRPRLLADEGRLGRPAGEDGARAGRRALGRRRPRDAGARARRPGRPDLAHRHRRAHARRRHRLALAPARPDDRQPALGRARHRRRPARHRLASTSTRTSSGGCAAAPATSASSSRSSTGCTRSGRSSSAARSSTTLDDAAAALRNARDFFVDAPDEVSLWLVLTHVPPRAAVPAGALGRRRCSLVVPFCTDLERGPGAARAAHLVRLAAREPARADPVHGAAVRARRRRPARAPLLGARRLPRRPLGRRDRRAGRGRARRVARSAARSWSSRWAARSPACRRTRPRSATARRRGRSGSRASGPTRPRTRSTATGRAAFSASLAPLTTGAVYVNAIGGDVTEARKLAAYGGAGEATSGCASSSGRGTRQPVPPQPQRRAVSPAPRLTAAPRRRSGASLRPVGSA